MIAVRLRRVFLLTAALALAMAFVPVGGAGLVGSTGLRENPPAGVPTLYVQYTMNCTFTIHDDNGNRVSSIAPGTYQIEVSTPVMLKLVDTDDQAPNDFTACKGFVQFQLTGPGVNLGTTLDAGCVAFTLLPKTSFKASSTFTAQDLNQPGVTRTVLTTTDSGTPPTPKSAYTATSGKGTTSGDLVGSSIGRMLRGKLTGTLGANGKPTLTTSGKTVSTLRAGRYKFQITDQSPSRSFVLETRGKSTDLTGVKFVGKHSVTLALKAGVWTYSSGLGKGHSFRVTG